MAQGDFTRRQPVTSRDELGVLTESFNTMTAQLAEAQQKTEESRRATETTRAYLESILGNLSAGVLAFDDRYRLRTANASAAVILQQPLAELTGMPLSDWGRKLPALAPFAELVAERLSREPRRALAEAGGALGRQSDAHAADARIAAAGHARGRLRRRVRRRHRSRAGAARCGVGRGRAPPRARDQESADADPALGRAARAQALGEARRRRPGDADARRADDHRAGGGDEAHGRRLRDLRAAAAAGDDAAGRRRRPLARRARVVRQSASARRICRFRPSRSSCYGEPTRLRQVFHNLLQNAIDAQARLDRAALRHRARGARRRGRARVRRRRRGVSGRRAAPRVRAVRDDQGEGHGAGSRDREEDRRRAPRPSRARQRVAARGARHAHFPAQHRERRRIRSS